MILYLYQITQSDKQLDKYFKKKQIKLNCSIYLIYQSACIWIFISLSNSYIKIHFNSFKTNLKARHLYKVKTKP